MTRSNQTAGDPVTTITAIPTRYAGCHFRSRLEARWAVFFDTIGIAWQYEPQGYELHGRKYLPDFWLPQIETWYEVKGEAPTNYEKSLASMLEESTGNRVIIAWGDIPRSADCGGYDSNQMPARYTSDGLTGPQGIKTTWDINYAWCICPWCDQAGIEFEARSARIHGYQFHNLTPDKAWELIEDKPNHWRIDDKCYSGDHPRVLQAFSAARSARFEHGQSG